MRVIVALSGGKASAWCANWALKTYKKEEVILYFNDTKWEHSDLYRFLNDLSEHFDHPITYDNDGRSVDQLFWDKHALANNRMPFCSRILKAERLQRYCQNNDTIVFGIGIEEINRAHRIVGVYQKIYLKTGKEIDLKFPLIYCKITKQEIDKWLKSIDIKGPILYKLGFSHNNCSGGCIRAGKKQWKHLYERLPDVYAEREKLEEDMGVYFGKRMTILKDESLKEFRLRIEQGDLSEYYYNDTKEVSECIGICDLFN